MNNFSRKIRLVYLPFLSTSISFIVAYSALNWWMFMQNDFWGMKEEVPSLIGPIFMPWLPVLILVRPKLNLLQLQTRAGKSWLSLYLMVSGLSMTFPILIAQQYLLTATGKLTVLNNISNINNLPPTKFYVVTSYYVDKDEAKIGYFYSIGGKYGQRRDLAVYIACPIYNDDMTQTLIGTLKTNPPHADTANGSGKTYPLSNITMYSRGVKLISKDSASANTSSFKPKSVTPLPIPQPQVVIPHPNAWLCVRYTKSISNRDSYDEIKASSDAFYDASLEEFNSTNLEAFKYLDRLGNTRIRDEYTKTILGRTPPRGEILPIITEPKFTDFSKRNGNKLAWVFGSFSIGAVVFLLMLINPKFKEPTQ